MSWRFHSVVSLTKKGCIFFDVLGIMEWLAGICISRDLGLWLHAVSERNSPSEVSVLDSVVSCSVKEEKLTLRFLCHDFEIYFSR